jgi:hypothetical protein
LPSLKESIIRICRNPLLFAEHASGLRLRGYQEAVAQAIVNSVIRKQGLSFVVLFPRQSGKNELQAQIETYLLAILSMTQAEIVKVSPTWKPQSLNAMRRLERVISRNLITRDRWTKESGYIYKVGAARIYFLSGAPGANIVGATASTLLEVDEAQDVSIEKFDKEIAPMAASTNATRVFWGTAWTSRTLLARELRAAQDAEKQDGIQRTFVLSADQVAGEVPAYGKFVQEQIARLGRNNPMIKTQFFSEEIDAEGGMFNKTRQALMQGTHKPQESPEPPSLQGGAGGRLYAITIDVAGEDEAAREEPGAVLQNPGRDSTALTIFEIDTSTLEDPLINRPTYKVVKRKQWTGIKHTALFGQLTALIDLWAPRWIVIDATGVGQTISGFLFDRYPNVIPFTFTQASKSQLGWDFLTVIETGRYKEFLPSLQGGTGGRSSDPLQSAFWTQAEFCQYSILEGPGRIMRWGVPDGTRDPHSGDLVHDDLLISAALVTQLDAQPFGLAVSKIIPTIDPAQSKDF